jgi:hypothetical protein
MVRTKKTTSTKAKKPKSKRPGAKGRPANYEFKGRLVRKKFREGVFEGIVDAYDPKTKWWHVTYPDDGDAEEMTRSELAEVLVEEYDEASEEYGEEEEKYGK